MENKTGEGKIKLTHKYEFLLIVWPEIVEMPKPSRQTQENRFGSGSSTSSSRKYN